MGHPYLAYRVGLKVLRSKTEVLRHLGLTPAGRGGRMVPGSAPKRAALRGSSNQAPQLLDNDSSDSGSESEPEPEAETEHAPAAAPTAPGKLITDHPPVKPFDQSSASCTSCHLQALPHTTFKLLDGPSISFDWRKASSETASAKRFPHLGCLPTQ